MKSMMVNKTKLMILTAMLAVCLLVSFFSPMQIKAEEATEIWTYEDLLKIADNPGGSYQLKADIDMKDHTWKPVDFTGTFDGNGHALLNVRISETGSMKFSTFDGNMIEYETEFAGVFSSLVNASVSNLKVLGIDLSVSTDTPVFVGGIAGYMENSTISNCSVYGQENLITSGHSFGIGGIAGFGNGLIENTSAEMTLVCTDTDREYKDEQFMGGAYAAGYIDLRNNTIVIDGYDSDHGYVHDGGLVGMYILYPEDTGYAGFITGNTVDGMITFFEDNEDRRAYCEAYIGEIMNWTFAYDDDFDPDHFVRNEVYDYDTDLVPHSCSDPQYEKTVTEPTETENGYTTYRCLNDGYTFRADFTPVLGNYVPAQEETKEQVTEADKQAQPEKQAKGGFPWFLILLMVVLVIVIIILIVVQVKQKKKMERERERARRSRSRQRRR